MVLFTLLFGEFDHIFPKFILNIKKEYKKRFEKKLGEKDRVYNKLGYYDKELKKLDVRKRKMMNLYLDEDISKEEKDDWIENEYNKKVVDYKDKIKGLERELPKYDNKKNLDGWIELMERDLSNEYYWRTVKFFL